ncbi:MAG TPA: hypothetical protein VIN09_10575 [Chloroflexota bacterium]
MRPRPVRVLVLALALLLIPVGTGYASMQSPSPWPKGLPKPQMDAPGCVVLGKRVAELPTPEEANRLKQIEAQIGKRIVRYEPGETVCFNSFREFIERGGLGAVQREQGARATSDARAQAANSVAVLWEHAHYGGDWVAYLSDYDCYQPIAIDFRYVGDRMNDRASSAGANETEFGCNTFTFYKDPDLQPAPGKTMTTPVSYVGNDYNDQLSSFIVYRW